MCEKKNLPKREMWMKEGGKNFVSTRENEG